VRDRDEGIGTPFVVPGRGLVGEVAELQTECDWSFTCLVGSIGVHSLELKNGSLMGKFLGGT